MKNSLPRSLGLKNTKRNQWLVKISMQTNNDHLDHLRGTAVQLDPLGFILGFQKVLGDPSSYFQAQPHVQCGFTLLPMAGCQSFWTCDLELRRTTRPLSTSVRWADDWGRGLQNLQPFLPQLYTSLTFLGPRKKQEMPTERLIPSQSRLQRH